MLSSLRREPGQKITWGFFLSPVLFVSHTQFYPANYLSEIVRRVNRKNYERAASLYSHLLLQGAIRRPFILGSKLPNPLFKKTEKHRARML